MCENKEIMLCSSRFAERTSLEYQKAENLVYCDYLEHLLLHTLICKEAEDVRYDDKTIVKFNMNTRVDDIESIKQKDYFEELSNIMRKSSQKQGIGGVINFIAPELNDVYSGFKPSDKKSQQWRKIAYDRIINDKDVYLLIIKQFIEILYRRRFGKKYYSLIHEHHYNDNRVDSFNIVDKLTTSFNEKYGLWSSENNKAIYDEIRKVNDEVLNTCDSDGYEFNSYKDKINILDSLDMTNTLLDSQYEYINKIKDIELSKLKTDFYNKDIELSKLQAECEVSDKLCSVFFIASIILLIISIVLALMLIF